MQTRFNIRTLAGALALAATLAAPTLAAAQTPCTQWDVSHTWWAVQGKYQVGFQLAQQGTRLSGTASYWSGGDRGVFQLYDPFVQRVRGAVSGSIRGDSIELETEWGGVYIGTIDATGRIDGTTYDKRDSTSSARWYSDHRMNCLARVPEAPPPAPAAPPAPRAVPVVSSGVLTGARGSAAASALGIPRPAPAPAPASAVSSSACQTGYVWREARPSDLVCVTPESRARVAAENRTRASRVQPGGGAYGPNTCRAGYVWRDAFSGDGVCVTPAVRALVQEENRLAASRVQRAPAHG